jgi:hypothetical protein
VNGEQRCDVNWREIQTGRLGDLYWSAEGEAGEGGQEEVSTARGQREEVDEVLLHQLHQLVLVGLREQLCVVLAEVVREEEEVPAQDVTKRQ